MIGNKDLESYLLRYLLQSSKISNRKGFCNDPEYHDEISAVSCVGERGV